MNFPVGNVVSKAHLPINFELVFNEFNSRKFNGYIIQSVKSNCLEEGVLFFREGEMIACMVECLKLKQVYKSNEALNYFLSQTKAVGFFQAIELTRSQVDLVTAFDEKMLISNKISLKDLPKLIPNKFESKFVINDDKKDFFEKLGLDVLKN